jgi:hypothetical protein
MKLQMQLWIEVCPFDNSFVLKIKNEHETRRKDKRFFNSVFEVMEQKYAYTEFGFRVNPDESRETIIKALEEYQNSILPEGVGIYYNNDYDKEVEKGYCTDEKFLVELGLFYDPETRIITITKFEENK